MSAKDFKRYFKQYCKVTSVHGFLYLGESERSRFERYLWFIILIISFSCCSYTVYCVYTKWEHSPVIVNFGSQGIPIYKIPFPAVTICPETKTVATKFNFTKVLQKKEDGVSLTSQEDAYFEYLSMICQYNPHITYSENATFSDDFFDTIDYLKPEFQIMNCSFFLAHSIDCDSLFIPILTEDGVCYSFNILNRSEVYRDMVLSYKNYHVVNQKVTRWTIESGYDDNVGINLYPYRAYISGITKGLSLNIITPDKDLDYACTGAVQGYKVLLYTPMTVPRPSMKYFRLPLDQKVVADVEPQMIRTSEAVKKYSAAKRGCFFQNERYLEYFQYYTSNNCKLECLTNYTLLLCDCVDYYMPRYNGTPICGTGRIKCMEVAEGIMHYTDMEHKIEHQKIIIFPDDFQKNCNCLPLCSDLSYEVDLSQSTINREKWMNARRNWHVKNAYISSLTVYFNWDTFITSERNELYGPIDFLANFGGLIGLFTGVSVLSLVELLYFLTIRIFCNLRIYNHWSP